MSRQQDQQVWLIQSCSTPGCEVVIRVPVEHSLVTPICKWCDQGVSRAKRPKSWPDGMPDPELPWPWTTDEERARQAATAFWQERFRRYPDQYGRWMTKTSGVEQGAESAKAD